MTAGIQRNLALRGVSQALQELHHHLLFFQADEAGFSGTSLQLFDRANSDDAFSWLRLLREQIVALDEHLSSNQPLTPEETAQWRKAVDDLIGAQRGVFREKLNSAFQSQPKIVSGIGNVKMALAKLE